ncbi:MAG: MarR family transcriptional regulator [Methanolobus sp.]|nr:MarR family transcriptional regulator [Methanolobus sp.]
MDDRTILEFSFDKVDQYYNDLIKGSGMSGEFEDISFNAYMYLKKIYSLGQPSLSELALSMKVKKPSASTMVHKLKARGLVDVSPSLKDRRMSLLKLTDKGVKFIECQESADRKLVTRIREILDDEEFVKFSQLWHKVSSNLDGDPHNK